MALMFDYSITIYFKDGRDTIRYQHITRDVLMFELEHYLNDIDFAYIHSYKNGFRLHTWRYSCKYGDFERII